MVALSSQKYILAIDQGTTGSTALLLDSVGSVAGRAYTEITQIYPQPGWVEHDPEELFQSCLAVIDRVLADTSTEGSQIEAVGITNQRETTVVWERSTGVPVANAVVWQCRRTAGLCGELKSRGLEATVRAKTGLPIDAYFSATKVRWLLDSIPNGRRRAEEGELLFGTVDSWLIWKLTGGAVHATDVTNASRTMLFNIDDLTWDDELLQALDIPRAMLPEVRSSSEVFGHTRIGGHDVPISGVAGDQHAALFGQACFEPGMVKSTYGTGCFVLMNTGDQRVSSKAGLISTIGWAIGDEVVYALEGSVFAAGSTVQWLRDGLGLIDEAPDVNELAATVEDNGGVYLVPAFTGLGAPHWDMNARGTIVGITRGTSRGHLARAALEAIAYQTKDVVYAMEADTSLDIPILRVDGGGAASNLTMQFQADVLDTPIERCAVAETTALGAGYLAGLAVGFWSGLNELAEKWQMDARFDPSMEASTRKGLHAGWTRAVERAKGWET